MYLPVVVADNELLSGPTVLLAFANPKFTLLHNSCNASESLSSDDDNADEDDDDDAITVNP